MKDNNCPYTTRLQKGGALLDDMRFLVRTWREGGEKQQRQQAISENILGKQSRARVADTFRRSFLPRFVEGNPPQAWRIIRPLEDRHLPAEIIRPVYYWITARSERLLYDYASENLMSKSRQVDRSIRPDEVASWIRGKLAPYHKSWSQTVTIKVARGLLAALRDFHIIEGTIRKQVAPVYLPLESFVYIALALHFTGSSGESLVEHPDWRLFLLTPEAVERLFLEAHQAHLVSYHAAGKIVRIEFPARSLEEMADVIAARAH
jgi:hypothetical protein